MTGTDNIGSNNANPEDHPEDNAEDEQRLEELVRLQTDTLPSGISTRLAAMRRQAVSAAAEGEDTSRFLWSINWSTRWRSLALAGTAGAVMLSVWLVARPGNDLLEIPLISESEVVLVQDLALLEELEFVVWLEGDGFEEGGLNEEKPGAG